MAIGQKTDEPLRELVFLPGRVDRETTNRRPEEQLGRTVQRGAKWAGQAWHVRALVASRCWATTALVDWNFKPGHFKISAHRTSQIPLTLKEKKSQALQNLKNQNSTDLSCTSSTGRAHPSLLNLSTKLPRLRPSPNISPGLFRVNIC